MNVTATLDLNVIPLDTADEVTVLVELTAPRPAPAAPRPPATLQIVLDRSGSMADGKLAGAQRALRSLVSRLDPADNFGLVGFDDTALVEIPAGPLTDKDRVREEIDALRPGGGTNLSGGLLRGLQEARRVCGDRGATLLLISDGHANVGITEPGPLVTIARDAHRHGVTISTIGYGLGYHEALLSAIADAAAGSALHAADPDTAGRLIAGEVTHLLAQTCQAVSLTVAPASPVTSVHLYGELPGATLPGGAVMAELGDLYAGETRRLLLRLAVPGIGELGPATVAELVFTYVATATLTAYTVTVPIVVNVLPGAQAAGRIPDPVVRAERLFQEAQEAKYRATEALLNRDAATAEALLTAAAEALEEGLSWAPDRAELAEEAKVLRRFARQATRDANRTAKESRASWHHRTRKRGRPEH